MSAGIWLPDGSRADLGVLRVDKFVSEYDERLRFGRNVDTGQFCVYIVMRGQDPLPILGFNEVPDNDTVARELYKRDALRRGTEIFDEMERHNAAIERETEQKAIEGQEQAAEVIEWFNRTQGKNTGVTKIRLNEIGRRGRQAR